MATHHTVAIVHSQDYLLKIPSCICLAQAPVSDHQLKHIPTGSILQHDCQIVWRQKDLNKRIILSVDQTDRECTLYRQTLLYPLTGEFRQ